MPLLIFLSNNMGLGLQGIWIGQCIGSLVVSLAGYYKWKTMNLELIVKEIRDHHLEVESARNSKLEDREMQEF